MNKNYPAFPVPNLEHDESFNGMTLRDYFAAKAMQGIFSQREGLDFNHDERAEFAYYQADAMMKAREA